MGWLLPTVIKLRGYSVARKLDRAAERPLETQRSVLLDLIARNADTAFGRDHRFKLIRSETDYRRQVPIRDYEGIRPYVDRIIQGEDAVLTASAPQMLNTTSGTTGDPKYIPVTAETLSNSGAFALQWLYRALKDHPSLLAHAFAAIVSRAIEGRMPSGLPYGSASGMLYQRIPRAVRSAYAIPYLASEIRNYDQRYFVAARLALAARVSYIGTPNPSTLIRLAETGASCAEQIIGAIHDGRLGIELPDQPDVAAQLEAGLSPDPARARDLEHAAGRAGTLRPLECWPDLALIGCWLGGSVGTQARRLKEFYGDVPIRDLGYLASEGHFTIPHEDHTASGILALHSGYFEFIPEEAVDEPEPPVLSCHQLELGRRYAVLLTTAGGLYRYDIHDIVQVTGSYRQAPLLAFIRKGRDMTSITGEKMHVNHLLLALEQIKQRYDVSLVDHFRLVADVEESRYHLYAEFKSEVSHELLRDEVLPDLDAVLAEVNVEYGEKRRSRRLAPLILHLMQPGWAEREYQRTAAAGKRDTQYKWQILCAESRAEDIGAIVHTIELSEERAE
jgi:hypothetical protein